ncbi:MAG: type II toxin-antitoxin system VapC family toxin [Alphaproteobacteria bacterium]|nr:type II toxin-antitoxin system VapC family toxin [Alphaproteobacteria bacterium]
MMLYMLDTNVVSAIMHDPYGPAATRLQQTSLDERAMSIIVAAELRFGIAKRSSKVLAGRLEALIAEIPIVPFRAPADEIYAELRARLEKQGTPAGANDMLIAAHALALGATLVTDNEREFARIKSLKVENWLR